MSTAASEARGDDLQFAHTGFGRAQIGMLASCVMLNLLDGFDVTAMAIAKTAVAADLGLTASQLGILDGIALFGMCLGAMFLGALADIVGRRRTILTAVTIIAISMALTTMVDSFFQFLLIRLVTGLGVGATLASIAATVSEYTPDKYRGLAVTLATVGYPAGAMLGGTFGPNLIDLMGWQGLFGLGAAATAVSVGVAWFMLPESMVFLARTQPPGAEAKISALARKFGFRSKPELDPSGGQSVTIRQALFGVYNNVGGLFAEGLRLRTYLLWTTFFFCFITLYFLMSWIPFLIEKSGYSSAEGGYGFALFNVGAIIGVICVGWISTRVSLSSTVGCFLLASAALMGVTAAVSFDLTTLLALVLFIGIFQQGGFTGLYACAAKAYPQHIQATGVGWSIGLGRIGAIVGPATAGYLIEGGMSLSATFGWFALPMALSGLFALLLKIR